MERTTMIFGALFVVIGAVAFGMTQAPTSLIPGLIGALMIFLAWFGTQKPDLKKNLMHGSVLMALLMFLSSVPAVPTAFQMLSGADVERPVAVIVRSITTLLSGTYIGLAVQSFINARKNR